MSNELMRDAIYRCLIRSIGSVLIHACPDPTEPIALRRTARHLASSEAACVVAVREWAGAGGDIVTSMQREFAFRVCSGVEALLLPEHTHILNGLSEALDDR